MRVRKHKLKRYNKIIKKYYLIDDDFMRKMYRSLHTRVYPDCVLNDNKKYYNPSKSKYKKKVKKEKFKTKNSFEKFIPMSKIYAWIPITYYNPVKRSRVKDICNGYIMCSRVELNEILGTEYDEMDFENMNLISYFSEW